MTKGGSSRGRSKSQGSDDTKEARSPARHSSDRRPLRFWQPFNDWWRSTFEKKEGRRPDAQEITVWYNEHASSLWKEGAPTLQETRIHAKCLRSLPLVRDYFRNYRARKRSVSDRSGSMGPGEDYDMMDQEDGGDGGAGGGDPDYALRRRSGRGRSGSRGGGQRGARRGGRRAAESMEDEEDGLAEDDDDDVDGDAVAGLTQLANLAAAAQSASPSRDDGRGGRLHHHRGGGSDGDGEGRGEDAGGLGNGMSLDQLLAAPALLSPTTAALLAVHRAGLEAADGAGGGAGAAGGLPGDLLQRLTMQAAAVQQQFALAALAHNLAASQQAAGAGAAEEEASGAAHGSGDAGDTEEGTFSGRSSKRQRTAAAAAAAAAGGEGPSGAEAGDDEAGAEPSGRLGSRRSLRKEAEPAAEAAAPSGRGRSAGSWRGGGDSRQGGSTKRRGQHGGAGSGPAGQAPLDEDSLAGLNGLAVAALELSGMGLPEPGGVVLPPPLELLHVPPALSLEPMGREALQALGREQLVDRVLLLQAHLQLAAQQPQQQAASGLQAAGGAGGLGAGSGGLPMMSPATRLLQSLPAGMSPGQKLNAILAQEGLLREPAATAGPAAPAVLGVPLPPLPQVKQQQPEQQSSVTEQEAAAVRAVGQRTPPQPTEVRSPVRPELKTAEEGPSSTAAAATTAVGVGYSDAGKAAAAGDDESMGDPAPSEGDEARLQGGGGAPEVASAPTAVVA